MRKPYTAPHIGSHDSLPAARTEEFSGTSLFLGARVDLSPGTFLIHLRDAGEECPRPAGSPVGNVQSPVVNRAEQDGQMRYTARARPRRRKATWNPAPYPHRGQVESSSSTRISSGGDVFPSPLTSLSSPLRPEEEPVLPLEGYEDVFPPEPFPMELDLQPPV